MTFLETDELVRKLRSDGGENPADVIKNAAEHSILSEKIGGRPWKQVCEEEKKFIRVGTAPAKTA